MITTTTHVTTIGDVSLHEHHTEMRLAAGSAGVGIAYRRPVAVEHHGRTTAIHDVVLRIRLVAVAVVVVAVVARRLTP